MTPPEAAALVLAEYCVQVSPGSGDYENLALQSYYMKPQRFKDTGFDP